MGKYLNLAVSLALFLLATTGCAMNQCGCGDCCGYDDGCCDPCSCECGDYCCGETCGCGDCCEPACGCSCGDCCEPSCGCGGCCNGRDYAGQTWDSCGCEGLKMCGCTGPCNCYEPGCGCECGDCCEPGCECGGYCDSGCGCSDYCEPSCNCRGSNYSCGVGKFFSSCSRFCNAMFGRSSSCGCGDCCEPSCGCSGCGCSDCDGCSSELYWSEWHNDPPRCCDPCDRCGNWIGPSAGYQAPYSHPYQVSKHVNAVPSTRTAQKPNTNADQPLQR